MKVIKHPAIHVSVPKLVKILPPCRLMLLPLNQVVLPAALPRLLLSALIVMTVMLNPAALVWPILVVTVIHILTNVPARPEPSASRIIHAPALLNVCGHVKALSAAGLPREVLSASAVAVTHALRNANRLKRTAANVKSVEIKIIA